MRHQCCGCGTAFAPQDRFCLSCGAARQQSKVPNPSQPRCGQCSALVEAGDTFCPGCGSALPRQSPQAVPPPRPRTPPAPSPPGNSARPNITYQDPQRLGDDYHCPKCNAVLTTGARKCPACGVEFLNPVPQIVPRPSPPTPAPPPSAGVPTAAVIGGIAVLVVALLLGKSRSSNPASLPPLDLTPTAQQPAHDPAVPAYAPPSSPTPAGAYQQNPAPSGPNDYAAEGYAPDELQLAAKISYAQMIDENEVRPVVRALKRRYPNDPLLVSNTLTTLVLYERRFRNLGVFAVASRAANGDATWPNGVAALELAMLGDNDVSLDGGVSQFSDLRQAISTVAGM
jgi:RNA polymerase subunit RPABC4/transcription elongation factor Spt4